MPSYSNQYPIHVRDANQNQVYNQYPTTYSYVNDNNNIYQNPPIQSANSQNPYLTHSNNRQF